MRDYNFGNFICFLREQKGLTQADIARMLDITPAAVSKWENGESKPRVEVLFRLAEILGARPEELMAGKFMRDKFPDEAAVRKITEEYEQLRRVESYSQTSVKLKRIAAWLIDWNIAGFFWLFLMGLTAFFYYDLLSDERVTLIYVLGAICFVPIFFIGRDFFCEGRSLGKRIMGLTVLDIRTGKRPSYGLLFVRGLSLFFMEADLLVILISGRSIGDHMAHTAVVSQKSIDSVELEKKSVSDIRRINSYRPQKKRGSVKKAVIILSCGILAFFVLVIGLLFFTLHQIKDTEEYAIAYDYFVSSEEFQALNVSEDKIFFNSYRASSYTRNGETETRTEISFMVGLRTFIVVLHQDGEQYTVCEDCTGF